MSSSTSLNCESLTAAVARLSELFEPYDPEFPELFHAPVQLFIFNVPFNATLQDLERHLNSVCTVSNCRLVDKLTPKRKRFGFVQVSSKRLACLLIDNLHQQFFMGRRLGIQVSNRQQESSFLQ